MITDHKGLIVDLKIFKNSEGKDILYSLDNTSTICFHDLNEKYIISTKKLITPDIDPNQVFFIKSHFSEDEFYIIYSNGLIIQYDLEVMN